MKKNKLFFVILGFILSPLVTNANTNNKIDWVQVFKLLNDPLENEWIQVFELSNEPLENEWIQGFKLKKEEKLFFECEGYQYSYYTPKKCWSNYNRYRNNTNLSYDHWLPSTSTFDRRRPHQFYHPKSFKDWDKYKNGAYTDLK